MKIGKFEKLLKNKKNKSGSLVVRRNSIDVWSVSRDTCVFVLKKRRRPSVDFLRITSTRTFPVTGLPPPCNVFFFFFFLENIPTTLRGSFVFALLLNFKNSIDRNFSAVFPPRALPSGTVAIGYRRPRARNERQAGFCFRAKPSAFVAPRLFSLRCERRPPRRLHN